MKKLLLILALFASLSLDAQFVTTFAKNATDIQSDGILYYLPRNVIRLELTIEETEYVIGPYAEFASKLLGINDYIKENKSESKIKNIDIQTFSKIDPNAVYYISQDDKGKDPLPNVIMDTDGLMLAFGYDNIPAEYKNIRNSFINNNLEPNERIEASFIEILDNEVEIDDDDDDDDEEGGNKPKKITKEDKAKVAIEKIATIRNAYYELMSGSQEVAYGETTKYMAENLKNLENEYISLFKGKAVTHTYNKVFYVEPEDNQSSATLSIAKISGETLKIQFESNNSLENIAKMSDEVRNSAQISKLFYRIPTNSNVKILFGSNVIAEKSLTISQFGYIKAISVKNNKIIFNPNTGQIISLTK